MSWGQRIRRKPRTLYGAANLPPEDRFKFDLRSYWLARHNKTILEQKTILIRCLGGKMHKITFRFPGHITLHGHPDLKGEVTMMKLGGEKPYCLQFLEDWKKEPSLAMRSRDTVIRFCQARQDIRKLKDDDMKQYADWLELPLAARFRTRVARLYARLIDKIGNMREAKNDSTPYYNYRYGRTTNESGEADNIVRPSLRFQFTDLINKKEETKE